MSRLRASKGRFPRRTALTGLVFIGVGAAYMRLGALWWTGLGLIAAGLFVTAVPVAYWASRGRHGIVAMTNVASHRNERNGGFVLARERFTQSSKWAMRWRWAIRMRPDLFTINREAAWKILGVRLARLQLWWLLLTVDVAEYAADLGRDNHGGYYLPNNTVVLRIGAARSGKSVAMAWRLVQHRGPAVVTSTRKDLLLLSGRLRARSGNLLIWNVGDVGAIASTVKISLLAGCRDMTTAERRAGQLVGEATNSEERDHWNEQAWRVLAPMLYAAAHANLSMRAVARWVAAGGDEAHRARLQIVTILGKTPEGKAQLDNINQFFSMIGAGDRTRLSITTTLAKVLSWLGNPRIAALGDARGDNLFDIHRDLLTSGNTLYILGATSRGTKALTGALVAEIFYQATQYAETLPRTRLSPALLLMLDELALTCGGQPVADWTKTAGGSGMPMDLGIQQRSALDRTFGEDDRMSIMGNASATLIGAGCNDPTELAEFSLMTGLRYVPRTDEKGKILKGQAREEVPVVSIAALRSLAIGNVIAMPRGPIVKLKTPNAETKRAVRKAGLWEPTTSADTNFEASARSAEAGDTAPNKD